MEERCKAKRFVGRHPEGEKGWRQAGEVEAHTGWQQWKEDEVDQRRIGEDPEQDREEERLGVTACEEEHPP